MILLSYCLSLVKFLIQDRLHSRPLLLRRLATLLTCLRLAIGFILRSANVRADFAIAGEIGAGAEGPLPVDAVRGCTLSYYRIACQVVSCAKLDVELVAFWSEDGLLPILGRFWCIW